MTLHGEDKNENGNLTMKMLRLVNELMRLKLLWTCPLCLLTDLLYTIFGRESMLWNIKVKVNSETEKAGDHRWISSFLQSFCLPAFFLFRVIGGWSLCEDFDEFEFDGSVREIILRQFARSSPTQTGTQSLTWIHQQVMAVLILIFEIGILWTYEDVEHLPDYISNRQWATLSFI